MLLIGNSRGPFSFLLDDLFKNKKTENRSLGTKIRRKNLSYTSLRFNAQKKKFTAVVFLAESRPLLQDTLFFSILSFLLGSTSKHSLYL